MNPLISDFVSKHKTTVAKAVGVTALVAGAYAFGRYEQPAKVVTQEKVQVVQVEKQVVVVQEKVRVEKIYLKDTKEHVHTEDQIVTHVDGSKEEHRSEDRNTEVTVKEQQIKYVDRDIYHETVKYQDRVVEKEKVVEAKKPDWILTPMVGVNFHDLSLGQTLTTGPLVYGGEVQRRVLGPVYAGAWGLSSGQVGISASFQF